MISLTLYSLFFLSTAFASYRPIAVNELNQPQEQHSQNVQVRKAPKVIKDPESYDDTDNLETFPRIIPDPTNPERHPNHYESKVLNRRQTSDHIEEARPIPMKNNKPSFNYVKIDKADNHRAQVRKLNNKVEAIKAYKQKKANQKFNRRSASDDIGKLDKAEEAKPIPMKNNKPSFNYVKIEKTDNHKAQVKKLNTKVEEIKTYKKNKAKSIDSKFSQHKAPVPEPNQIEANPTPEAEQIEANPTPETKPIDKRTKSKGKFQNFKGSRADDRSLKFNNDEDKDKAKLNLKELGNGGVDKNPTDGAYI